MLINHSGNSLEISKTRNLTTFSSTRANVYHGDEVPDRAINYRTDCYTTASPAAELHHIRASRYIVGGWWIQASIHAVVKKGRYLSLAYQRVANRASVIAVHRGVAVWPMT